MNNALEFTAVETDAIMIGARTLYGEARGGGAEGMISVANVIYNRVEAPGWWGHDLASVCQTPDQFSCWLPGLDHDAMLRADLFNISFCAALAIATQLAADIKRDLYYHGGAAGRGTLPSLVGNATYYYASNMKTPPEWAAKLIFVCEIAGQRFYEIPGHSA